MGQVTLLSGHERRRRWSEEERLRILAEAFAPGACVSEVSRRREVSTALIYTWRRKLREACGQPAPPDPLDQGFAQAVLIEGAAPGVSPAIVIDLGRGKRVSIFASAPPALTAAALRALR